MKLLIAAIVCVGVLYLVDAYFQDGRYFAALSEVLGHTIRRL